MNLVYLWNMSFDNKDQISDNNNDDYYKKILEIQNSLKEYFKKLIDFTSFDGNLQFLLMNFELICSSISAVVDTSKKTNELLSFMKICSDEIFLSLKVND